MAESCNNLTRGLNPGCEALKKVGGVVKRIWAGQNSMLAGYTINETTLDFETISMALNGSVSYTLKKFIGRNYKHSGTYPLVVGENINVFNQSIILVLQHFSSLEKAAIEELANAEDVFIAIETFARQIEIYGIDVGENEDSEAPTGGLNGSAGDGGTGIALQDPTGYTLTLSGQHRNMPRIFNVSPTATLAQNIAYLDAISE